MKSPITPLAPAFPGWAAFCNDHDAPAGWHADVIPAALARFVLATLLVPLLWIQGAPTGNRRA